MKPWFRRRERIRRGSTSLDLKCPPEFYLLRLGLLSSTGKSSALKGGRSSGHVGIPGKGFWNSNNFLFLLLLLALEVTAPKPKAVWQPDNMEQPPKVWSKINLIPDIGHSKLKLKQEHTQLRTNKRGEGNLPVSSFYTKGIPLRHLSQPLIQPWRAAVESASDEEIAVAFHGTCIYIYMTYRESC